MTDKETISDNREEKFGSKPRWTGRISLLVIFFGIGIAIWYMTFFFSGPSVGTVMEKRVGYPIDADNIPSSIREWKGAYCSISLRESYLEKQHENFDGSRMNILESAVFSDESPSSRKLVVIIEKTPENGLDELSSYAFRTLHPKEYVRGTYGWDEKNIVIFRKESQVYEITGYIEGDGISASISITSAVDVPEELIADFSDIIKSFRWTSHESQ